MRGAPKSRLDFGFEALSFGLKDSMRARRLYKASRGQGCRC